MQRTPARAWGAYGTASIIQHARCNMLSARFGLSSSRAVMFCGTARMPQEQDRLALCALLVEPVKAAFATTPVGLLATSRCTSPARSVGVLLWLRAAVSLFLQHRHAPLAHRLDTDSRIDLRYGQQKHRGSE